jgi:two-component system, NarL family, response regulator NreC
MEKIKVFIVDDHSMIREGIKSCLAEEKDMEVVGEAESGEIALSMIGPELPDLVIMDINMGGMSGIETTEKLIKKFKDIKILGLTMYEDSNHIINMMQAGAMGYILKDSDLQEIVDAIRTIHSGESYFSNDVSSTLMHQFMKSKEEEKILQSVELELTPREIEILKLIAEEFTNQEIAEKLFISQRTVDTHRRNLIQKLNAKNTAGLVRYAIKHKLISL